MRSKMFSFRISDVLKERIRFRSESLGMPMAEYIKDLVKDDLKRAEQLRNFAGRIVDPPDIEISLPGGEK